MKIFALFIAVATFSISQKAFSYQEMVRHGYTNCTTCHISPIGGGNLLTEYGRALSKDVMSLWGSEGEEKPLHGLYTEPEWLRTGANFRVIQTYLNDPLRTKATAFPMQAEAEVGVLYNDWTLAVTGGVEGGREGNKRVGKYGSPSHYIMYRPIDVVSIRVGKYRANFGLNLANHVAYTEADLSFGPLSETYNFELGFQGEKIDAFATAISGKETVSGIERETGFVINNGYSIGEHSKVGWSYLNGQNGITERHLAGIHYVFGFSSKFYLMSEFDMQWRKPVTTPAIESRGIVTYNRLNYEFIQGIHTYAIHQLSYLDLNSIRTRKDSFGLGFQFFPRPHFELNSEYLRERNLTLFQEYYDVYWLMFHYYM